MSADIDRLMMTSMGDRKGDPENKPTKCLMHADGTCPHLEETHSDFECEVYHCALCGEHFTLYYDDIR